MFNRQELWTLFLFCMVYVSWGLTDSIQAPFYPIEATKKGATATEYGFVFGIIHLAIFFSGPIFGKYMYTLKVRRVYFFGIIVTAICALVFGTLDFIEDKATFLALSYTLRTLEGIAEAASWSAVFAMLLHMFPNNVATIYAITEASFSVAEMCGPTFGAFLYNSGGFFLPFSVCGSMCLLTGLFTLCVLPDNVDEREEYIAIVDDDSNPLAELEDILTNPSYLPGSDLLLPSNRDSILYSGTNPTAIPSTSRKASSIKSAPSAIVVSPASIKSERTSSFRSHRTEIHSVRPTPVASLWPVITNPRILIALFGTVFAASCEGLLEACLEQFLEGYSLTMSQIGLTFLAVSVPFFFSSMIWGKICDEYLNPNMVQPIGHIFIAVGFIFLAPVSYIPKEFLVKDYYSTIVGLVFLGIGTAALLVASFSGAQKSAMNELSIARDEVYAVIAGVWTSAFALGNFIGPTVGGLLMDNYGFAQTTTIFQITGLCFFCLDIINLCCCNLTKRVVRLAAKNTTNRKSSLISNTEIRYDLYQRIA